MENRVSKRSEVIVIGGGIIGTAITYYLSKMGKAVLLLERSDLASGTAGATDGYITYHTKKKGIHLDLALKSGQMYETLSDELGCDLGYVKNCGSLQVIDDEEQWEVVSRIAEEQRESGVPVSMLGIEEARKIEHELSKSLIGALYSPTASKVNPMKATFGFAKAAKKLGAQVLIETEVINVIIENGRAIGVSTNRGDFYADYIVNAAGSWGAAVAKMAGIDIPIKPRRGQIVVSEPVSPFVNTVMQCGRYSVFKHSKKMLKSIDEASMKMGLGFGIEQTEEGTLLLSNTREWAGFDRRNTLEAIEGIIKRAVKFLPGIKNMHFIRCFSGLRPYTPDGLPILGPVNEIKGFIMAAGHEGDGIALAPITGKLIAEYLTYEETSLSIDAFTADRFNSLNNKPSNLYC